MQIKLTQSMLQMHLDVCKDLRYLMINRSEEMRALSVPLGASLVLLNQRFIVDFPVDAYI